MIQRTVLFFWASILVVYGALGQEQNIRFSHISLENGLSQSTIKCILKDSKGFMWFGTRDGLNKYDGYRMTVYRHSTGKKGSINANFIYDVFGIIYTVFKDSKNNIWAGTLGSGLCLYNRSDNSFTSFRHDPENQNSVSQNDILSITEDFHGRLWLGTQNGGVSVFDHKKNTFRTYSQNIDDPTSIANNAIHSIYTDDQGNIWIGTWAGGVNLYSRFFNKFTHHKKILNFKGNNIYDITGDSEGNIWLSLEHGGLILFDRKNNTFKRYANESEKYFPTNYIFSITELNKDTLALGYHIGAFALFSKKTGKFTHFFPQSGDPNSIHGAFKPIVLKDHDQNIWIGDWGGGLSFYNKSNNNFTNYFPNPSKPNELTNGVVFGLCEDKDNNLWIGTEQGLNFFNSKTKQFFSYAHNDNDKKSLSHNIVYSVFEDSKRNLWVGTGGGLNLLDRKSGTFTSFQENDGLASGVINSILEDSKSNLWLGTNKGISNFNPKTKVFKNYDTNDGLQEKEFNRNASYRASNGTMFFGGTNGFNIFHPDSIEDNSYIPPIQISDLQIFNKSISIGESDSLIKNTISETKAITLSYHQSVFAIEYAALNYISTGKNQYAYKLEGFDQDWNQAKGRRLATYTNLNPGEYVFHVKGSNNDGIWNEAGASLKITITPPFWKMLWFRCLAILIIVGSFYSWYRRRINVIKKQKQVLENQVKERTAELLLQKEEVVAQAEHLKEANSEINILYSDIKDSIRAAEVIQKSILPSENFIKQYLSESFILYQPKDVVSGDFYWFNVIDDKIIIAAADCTGHGVSGAFMSINGYHLLNQAIFSLSNLDPSNILNKLNDDLNKVLHTQGENEEIQDGMDIALCILDKNTMKLQFTGANSPLYILRNGEIIHVKGNRFAIGLTIETNELFNKFSYKEIDIQKGDVIYIFSDGYADQLGGSGDQKFMYPRFRELLVQIGNEAMDRQLITLQSSFNEWKKDIKQMDDILVMGFRIT